MTSLLNYYLFPWIEKHYPNFYHFFSNHIEDCAIQNGRNNAHDVRMHLTAALRSVALAKLNGEEVHKNEFDEQIDVFFHLLDDETFGSMRALHSNEAQMRKRFRGAHALEYINTYYAHGTAAR